MNVQLNRQIAAARRAVMNNVEGAAAVLKQLMSMPPSYLQRMRPRDMFRDAPRVAGATLSKRPGAEPVPCTCAGGAEKDLPFRVARIAKIKERRNRNVA